jgi:ribosomal protein L24E
MHTCHFCSAHFEARADARFCSNSCRANASRLRRADEERAWLADFRARADAVMSRYEAALAAGADEPTLLAIAADALALTPALIGAVRSK